MSNKVIQSYVYHGDTCFFVSTITRLDSTHSPRPFNETIIWECNDETKERGKMLYQLADYHHTIGEHLRACKELFENGKIRDR